MKYSFNLGQQISKKDISKILNLSSADLAEKLNSQIGAFDEIINWGARYEGIYLAKIVKLEKHPDADKLNICKIDDGGAAKKVERDKDGLIQVVCGAPNAKEGIMVAWISPGSTVPSTYDDKETFVLSKIKLRGVESNGMLASEKELAISEDHSGILELTEKDLNKKLLKPGTLFKNLFGLDDIIVDFENKMFTHRPDCFGHIGIAREIAGIQSINFESPDWYKNIDPIFPKATSKLKLEVENSIEDVVPKYSAVCIEDIKVEPSPIWLKATLYKLGIRPINNIVDITNYLMILTGQPLHAFDYDKIKSGLGTKINIRKAKNSEKLTILGGKEITLDKSDIVITDGKNPIALGGVMGGANSEVDNNTKNIVIESANFNMYAIRRTSMRHGLFTDAVTRFTKSQPEAQTKIVLAKAIDMVKEFLPNSKSSEVIISNKKEFEYEHLNLPRQKVNTILGLDLSREQISDILNLVEIYSHEMLDEVCVTPPFWRTDLELEEDIIEEIGRLYGFNKIDAKLPIRRVAPVLKDPIIELKKAIRAHLSKLGANEVLTYNFVSEKLLKRAGQDPEMAYKIRNALSPELQCYRLSLVPNLLDKIHSNLKSGQDQFALFELGKSHIKNLLEKDTKLPLEFQRLGFVYANKDKSNGATYYIAKKYLENLLSYLNIEHRFITLEKEAFESLAPISSPFQSERSAGLEVKVGSKFELRGIVGEFNEDITKNFKLPESSAGFELDLVTISENFSLDPNYNPLIKFPSILQDITIKVPSKALFAEVESELRLKFKKHLGNSRINFTLRPISIFKKEDSNNKSIAFSIEFNHPEKTLNTPEVSKIVEKVKRSH
ncbi:MAG: phenylalanine--tRNA ligase subunit beta [Candidatus Nomurabacteria bacterium]|nr:MAG: phenylalanine--tRNA ligase subunit beta [Candidatus Nomurabacteria bacterium]